MFTFEISGFDEIERKLQQLADNAEAMDGEHSVTVETPEDFAAIPDTAWDAFIASRTRFTDWRTMQEKAAADWFSRGIGLA